MNVFPAVLIGTAGVVAGVLISNALTDGAVFDALGNAADGVREKIHDATASVKDAAEEVVEG